MKLDKQAIVLVINRYLAIMINIIIGVVILGIAAFWFYTLYRSAVS